MSRTGNKNRPLACTCIEFPLNPKWDSTTGKFTTEIPQLRATNKEVIDQEDGELALFNFERIDLIKQVELGLLTVEQVSGVFAVVRQAWDNHVNMPSDSQVADI